MPNEFLAENEPDTGDRVIRVNVRSDILDRIPLLVGDVLVNLRASLDYLAYQLVLAGLGRPPTEDGASKIYFPFAWSADKMDGQISTEVRGASKEAMDLITNAKPYKGGSESRTDNPQVADALPGTNSRPFAACYTAHQRDNT